MSPIGGHLGAYNLVFLQTAVWPVFSSHPGVWVSLKRVHRSLCLYKVPHTTFQRARQHASSNMWVLLFSHILKDLTLSDLIFASGMCRKGNPLISSFKSGSKSRVHKPPPRGWANHPSDRWPDSWPWPFPYLMEGTSLLPLREWVSKGTCYLVSPAGFQHEHQ